MAEMEYKCPNCGGGVIWDPTAGKVVCPFCGSGFDPAQLQGQEPKQTAGPPATVPLTESTDAALAAARDATAQAWSPEELSGMRQYSCPSCGGEIVTDATTAATHCPYCTNPVVLADQVSGGLRPAAVVPFAFTKDQAVAALQAHVKGKTLVPRVFRDRQHIDLIQGVYAPFWLFDADVHADVRFNATQVRTWADTSYTYTETSFFDVARVGDVTFTGIPADGSRKLDDTYMQAIEPFDMSVAKPFSMAYLSGFVAERYDVDADASRPVAYQRLGNTVRELVDQSVSAYATTDVVAENYSVTNAAVHYVLLPVWLLNTVYKDKTYCFAMNGQTGKFIGELPTSRGRFWAWLLVVGIGLGAVLAVLAMMLI